MLRNKKAQVAILAAIILIAIVAVVWYSEKHTYEITMKMGEKQNAMLEAYSAAEATRQFMKDAAEVSAMDAFTTLAANGGYEYVDCPKSTVDCYNPDKEQEILCSKDVAMASEECKGRGIYETCKEYPCEIKDQDDTIWACSEETPDCKLSACGKTSDGYVLWKKGATECFPSTDEATDENVAKTFNNLFIINMDKYQSLYKQALSKSTDKFILSNIEYDFRFVYNPISIKAYPLISPGKISFSDENSQLQTLDFKYESAIQLDNEEFGFTYTADPYFDVSLPDLSLTGFYQPIVTWAKTNPSSCTSTSVPGFDCTFEKSGNVIKFTLTYNAAKDIKVKFALKT